MYSAITMPRCLHDWKKELKGTRLIHIKTIVFAKNNFIGKNSLQNALHSEYQILFYKAGKHHTVVYMLENRAAIVIIRGYSKNQHTNRYGSKCLSNDKKPLALLDYLSFLLFNIIIVIWTFQNSMKYSHALSFFSFCRQKNKNYVKPFIYRLHTLNNTI